MRFALPLAVLALLSTGASAEDTILDVALASGGVPDDDRTDFDLLVLSVQTAGLAEAVGGLDGATLFAPNDAAFLNTATALGFDGEGEEEAFSFLVEVLTDLGEGDPIPVLTNILLYHIAPAVLSSEDVLASKTIETILAGVNIGHTPGSLFLRDIATSLRNPMLDPDNLDIEASNGIIHVIDRVLIPVAVETVPMSTMEPSPSDAADLFDEND